MSSIEPLSTRDAACILDVAPHVLLNHYRRHGHYKGVTPVKSVDGRLAWPAEGVGKLAAPSITAGQPKGAEQVARLFCTLAPSLTNKAAGELAGALLTGESCEGWRPGVHDVNPEHVRMMLAFASVTMQEALNRADYVETHCGPLDIGAACKAAARVVIGALRYRVGREEFRRLVSLYSADNVVGEGAAL